MEDILEVACVNKNGKNEEGEGHSTYSWKSVLGYGSADESKLTKG